MGQPGLLGRLMATMHGEVPADTLEAYRRAGNAVYDLLKQVEEKRLALKIQGTDPWAADPDTQAELLCAWNAFILQTLGDQFLDADYRSDPATTGYVPPVTAQQVLNCYRQVEQWLSRARQAHDNPGYRLDVHVPADLPPWNEVEPCPRQHLDAILEAAQAVRPQAEAAMGVFAQAAPSSRQQGTNRLRAILADASTKADYARQLWSGHVSRELHEQIERYAKGAMEGYYGLGQLLAMPQLLDAPAGSGVVDQPSGSAAAVPRSPGEPGFDPWCLTDPRSRAQWQRDRQAHPAIANLWRYDPDPARTLAIQHQIDAAMARGDVGYATSPSGQPLGNFFCCPWSAIYVAKRPVTIGDACLRPLQEFTFDVSAEEVLEGGRFKREVRVGNFQPTEEVDYCDPHGGRDHDG